MVASGDYVRKSKMQGTWSHGVVQKRCKGHFTALRCAVCFFREIGDNYMEMKDTVFIMMHLRSRDGPWNIRIGVAFLHVFCNSIQLPGCTKGNHVLFFPFDWCCQITL